MPRKLTNEQYWRKLSQYQPRSGTAAGKRTYHYEAASRRCAYSNHTLRKLVMMNQFLKMKSISWTVSMKKLWSLREILAVMHLYWGRSVAAAVAGMAADAPPHEIVTTIASTTHIRSRTSFRTLPPKSSSNLTWTWPMMVCKRIQQFCWWQLWMSLSPA